MVDVNVSTMFSLICGFCELSHDPAFNGDASPLASHIAFYVEIMSYLCEELKSVF